MPDQRTIAVLVEDDDSVAGALARALRRGFGADGVADDEEAEPGSPIAVPLADDEAAPLPLRIERAAVAVVLDPESLELARRASVPRVVALWPRFDSRWDGELDADLLLVCHEALAADAVRQGVPRKRITVVGPIAPDGWGPAEDRDALRAARELADDRPVVVVRGAALARDDLAPALVQLSLVSRDALWLFDVGRDADLARSLRRHVPGYGLDAMMFADGPESISSYQVADVVLGRVEGPEVLRAIAVGAAVVCVPPRSHQLRLAHILETERLIAIADAGPTLAVTLDAALARGAIEAGRQISEGLDAANGVARVVAEVRGLLRGQRGGSALAAGLPQGLERLSDAESGPRAGVPEPRPEPPRDDLDAKVDEELEALREKLGL